MPTLPPAPALPSFTPPHVHHEKITRLVPLGARRFFDGTVPPESKVPAHSAPTRKRQRAPSPIDLVALDQENSGGETEPRVLADGFMLRAYATESGSIGVQSGERVFLQFEGAQTKKGKRQRAVTAAYTAANASVVRVATQAGKTVRCSHATAPSPASPRPSPVCAPQPGAQRHVRAPDCGGSRRRHSHAALCPASRARLWRDRPRRQNRAQVLIFRPLRPQRPRSGHGQVRSLRRPPPVAGNGAA